MAISLQKMSLGERIEARRNLRADVEMLLADVYRSAGINEPSPEQHELLVHLIEALDFRYRK